MTVVQSSGQLVAGLPPWNTMGGISRGVLTYGGDFEDFGAIYRTQPNARLVISFLARNIAHLGVKWFIAKSETERVALDRAHALARLMRRPNPWTTKHRFIDALVHDRKIYDNFFALKAWNTATGQLNLFRIPPPLIEPVAGSWIRPDGWRLLGGNRPVFPVDSVVHLRGYNPSDSRIGTSVMETVRRLLAEEIASGEWREQFWRGGARISGVIERPRESRKWSDTARQRFISDFQAAFSGRGDLTGATPVLEDGMTWHEATFSPKDAEYLNARKLSREEWAAYFHVSPLFVGILENANFSNVAEQHKHLYQDTLGPDLDDYEEDFALQLLPEFPDLDPDATYLEFNLAEKLKGTFEEQASVLQTLVGAPVMVRDEGRARLNLPPLPDGQGAQIVTPLNVLVGGLPSPTAPPALAPGNTATAARKAATRKAIGDLAPAVQGWVAKHREVLGAFFTRQRSAVVSKVGAGQSLDTAFDSQRWDGELSADLSAVAYSMTEELGPTIAERFGGVFDATLATAWLLNNASIAAQNTNEVTRSALEAALADVGDDGSPTDAAGGVFDTAADVRADELSVSRSSSIANFAAHEAASQAGVPYKVWVVNSSNSRHPDMDGEQVPLGETFSNGGMWPGDPALGTDETAGCTCSLEFATEEA